MMAGCERVVLYTLYTSDASDPKMKMHDKDWKLFIAYWNDAKVDADHKITNAKKVIIII